MAKENVSSTAACPEMQKLMDTYGSKIGQRGELFRLGGDKTFYTWSGFEDAVCKYNAMRAKKGKTPFLGSDDMNINGLTLVGIMCNLEIETLHWTACKERVKDANGVCPCTYPACKGGCSGGLVNSYTSAKAKAAGWRITTCNGKTAPSQGCVDFWGNKVSNSEWCWWGRGATQLTWPGNYDMLADTVKEASNTDICEDPDSICGKDSMIAWLTAVAYWKKNEGPFVKSPSFQASLEVIRPADHSADSKREANWDAWVKALGLKPAPPPAASGTTIVQHGEGCWNIANRVCPGKGNSWATIICKPQGCKPSPAEGATVTYNCNGCR